MDIQTAKIELIKEVLEIENPELIERILNLLKKEKTVLETLNEETTNYKSNNSNKKNEKLNFIKEFINLSDMEIINKLENILWQKNDFWNELSPSQKAEIERADREIVNGETSDYEAFIALHIK